MWLFSFSFGHTDLITPASLNVMTPHWSKKWTSRAGKKQTIGRTAGSRRKASGMKVTLFIGMRGEGGCEARFVQWSGAFVKAEPRPRCAPASWDCAEFVFAAKESTGSKYRATLGRLISAGDAHLSRILCRRLTHWRACVRACVCLPAPRSVTSPSYHLRLRIMTLPVPHSLMCRR